MSIWAKLINLCYYLLAFVTPLLFSHHFTELFEFPKFIFVSLLTLVIIFFWIIRCVTENKLYFHRTRLDLPLIVFLSSQLISWLFSIDPHMSFWGYYSRWNGGVLSWLIYSALYWAAVSNLNSKSSHRFISVLLISASLVSIWGLLESFGRSPSCWLITGAFNTACWHQDVQARVFATFGQPNWLASFLVALVFSAIARIHNKFYLIFASLFLLTIFATHSRSGLLGLVVGGVIYFALTFYKKLLWLLVPLTIATTIYTFQLSRSATLSTQGTESVAIRINYVWPGAIQAWASTSKNILLGWGPDTFSIAYSLFRPASHNLTSEWQHLYNKAHNEYLNLLTTTGLFGFMAYIWLTKSAITKLRSHPALLAGFVSLLITNFWGFSTVFTNCLLLLLPALAHVLSAPPPFQPVLPWRYMWLFLLLPICLAVFNLSRYALANYYLALSKTAISNKDLVLAYQSAYTAYTFAPHEPTILANLGYACAYLAAALWQAEPTATQTYIPAAIEAAIHSVAIQPYNVTLYRQKAQTELLLSLVDEKFNHQAWDTISQARLLAPTDPQLIYEHYLLANEFKDASTSAQLKQQIIDLKPDFAF
jgi:hypothetical protein